MATSSGTVGATSIDATTIIEHSFRRCGKLASTVSSELQLAARENLFFLLSDLANRGLSLWCVQKHVIGVVGYQTTYTLPVGTVDINSCSYRLKTDLTGTTISGTGWQGLNLGSAAVVNTVSVVFSAATSANLVVESSADLGVTWSFRSALNSGTAVAAGVAICADVDNTASVQYWRVRDTSGVLASVVQLTFSNSPSDLPMDKFSNDVYAGLPNKTYSVAAGSRSLQYWFDKQINPQVWIWPLSQVSTDQIVVWTQSHIQDVGSLSNLVNIPQRWHQAVIYMLAELNAAELPSGELPEGRLEWLGQKAQEHLLQAEDSESDGSPIRIAPRIRGYSR